MSRQSEKIIIGFRFGESGQYEVLKYLGVIRPRNYSAYWKVKCHKCAEDSELWGNAEFEVLSASIKNNFGPPCGCKRSPHWTSDQYKVRMGRLTEENGYDILGFTDAVVSQTTCMQLRCRYHGVEWKSGSINKVITNGVVCPCCDKDATRRPDEDSIDAFFSTGKFADGTIFCREADYKGDAHRQHWLHKCPKCSVDRFAQAGLCTGIFRTPRGQLEIGNLRCRCSPSVRFTQAQQEYMLEEACSGGVRFVGWEDGYTTKHSKVLTECEIHGVQASVLSQLLARKSKCPLCSTKGGYRTGAETGYFYLLAVEGVSGDFTGYGVTTDVRTRLYCHKASLARGGFLIGSWSVFKGSAKDIADFELSVKRTSPLSPQHIDGFKTEATTSAMYPVLYSRLSERFSQCDFGEVLPSSGSIYTSNARKVLNDRQWGVMGPVYPVKDAKKLLFPVDSF